ncbi:MAG: HAD-IC family P-type ATPase [Chloroflexota bacterium]
MWRYEWGAEHKQTHPIALAIQQEAVQRELTPPPIHNAKYDVGYGLQVQLEDQLIRVGSERFMDMEGIAVPSDIQKKQEDGHKKGYTFVYVAIDDQLGGAIELRPTIRPEVKHIIHELTKRQKSLYIISGDHEIPTQKLAEALGIDHYFAQVLPQNKAALIEELQAEGKSVCFIGDGINDSVALKQANVSVSMSGASTVATDTASIILMDGSLKQLVSLFDIAQNLDANLNTMTLMTVLPGVVCIGGVFFLHLGIVSAVMLFNIGLVASVSNAMLPLIKHVRS